MNMRETSNMTKKLRFGIIGCGVIGRIHAEAITSLPDAQLVAVADSIPERAQELAEKFHVTPYEDFQEMLAHEELDVVDICTPSGQHGEEASQVMRSGRHVIVEKPMDVSHPALEGMLRVQEESGVKPAVMSQHRFGPVSLRAHEPCGE